MGTVKHIEYYYLFKYSIHCVVRNDIIVQT